MQERKSVYDRIEEFVKYHNTGDGECNNVVLKAWAEKHRLSLQERYELAFLFSVTYCVGSAIILFQELSNTGTIDLSRGALQRPELIFQSDRKYMRMKDSFQRCVGAFLKENRNVVSFIEKTFKGSAIDLSVAVPYVSTWEMFGRFSAFLMLETFAELVSCPFMNTTIEWKKGNTATSGLLNVFGYDEQAVLFDKKNKLFLSEKQMDKMLGMVCNCIQQCGGDPNVTKVETSLCAYRKFFKGSRYNGYYLDRMLEEIVEQEKTHPDITNELKEIRKQKFESIFLGELNGWREIRREMKHYYLQHGEINDLR